jgi:glycosyltransferase involved in cell wall biosynthesis
MTRPRTDAEIQKILGRHALEPGKYFFCLSNPKNHKNVSLLVHAYEEYRNRVQNPWPLVLSMEYGSPRSQCSHSGVIAWGEVKDDESGVLLSQAGGMFFPSLYEGFGLPPVEAAIAGVRLAISRIPPHLEGLIDLGPEEVIWVDPMNYSGWVRAFEMVQQSEIQPPSEEKRRKVADRFSLERMAFGMDVIYRKALDLDRLQSSEEK